MAQLVNTILISVVAFFAFLAVFGFLGGAPRPEPAPSSAAVHLLAVDASWEDAAVVAARSSAASRGNGAGADAVDAGDATLPDASRHGPGAGIVLRVTARNPGTVAANVVSATYTATSNGVTFDEATRPLDATMPAGKNTTMRIDIAVPSSAVPLWWSAYGNDREASGLRLEGTLKVGDATGTHDLPFAWSSTWQGTLASDLDAATFACRPADPVCVTDVATAWDGASLRVELALEPTSGAATTVRSGALDLLLADIAIAHAELDPAPTSLSPSDASASMLQATLAAEPAALAQWFPGHVERCESSRLEWRLTLETTDADGYEQVVTWSIRGTFQTHWLCGVRA